MKQYYIVIDGQQSGPYSPDELIALPQYNAEAYVWCEGMADWAHAGDIAELQKPENGAACPQPQEEQPQYEPTSCEQPNEQAQCEQSPSTPGLTDPGECPKPRLGLAIFSAIMFPLGIAAIVKTALIKVRWNQGRYDDARWLAETARKYAIRSLAIGFGILAFFFTYYIIMIAFILAL